MPHKLSDEQVQEILSLRREKKTYREIERITGINLKSCRKYCEINNVDVNLKRRYTDEEKDDIICLYLEGWTPSQLASKYNRHPTSIQNILRKNGIDARIIVKKKNVDSKTEDKDKSDVEPRLIRIKKVTYNNKRYVDVSEAYGL